MELLLKLIGYLNGLSKKQFHSMLLGVVGVVVGTVLCASYFVYQRSMEYVKQIKATESLSNKAVAIIEENQKMEDEALRIRGILDQNKEFNIKSFFESFCQQNSLTPNQGWDIRKEELNESFDEILLMASFKGLTTEKIVRIIEDFYKKEIIYIKSMSIKQEQDKKVSFDITIATKAVKRGL